MQILITGGAGFIGQHLANRLLQQGEHAIAVIDNLHRAAAPPPETRFYHADIRDRSALDEAMRGCDIVFHLAAQSNVLGSMQDKDYCFTTNVGGTVQVLQAAAGAGVKRIVFTSSREVYGEPDEIPVPETAPLRPKNDYGASKTAAEVYCRMMAQSGLEVAVLRLANVYGTGDTGRVIPLFAGQALRGEPLFLYDGTQMLDFVSIEIVVDALIAAGCGEYVADPVNVGSGQGTTIRELAERIRRLTASASPIRVEARRSAEVSRFVADNALAKKLWNLAVPDDPLSRLKDVIHC